MKFRILAAIAIASSLFTGCGVDELEDRVGDLEKTLGNEPLTVNFATKNNDNVDVKLDLSYKITPGPDYNYMGFNDDGSVYVYVERIAGVGWNEGTWAYLELDPDTKEVSFAQAGLYVYDKNWNWINKYFCTETYCGSGYAGNTITATVSSINTTTGSVEFSINASTTTNSPNNAFSGKAMTGTFKFRGKLKLYEND